MDLDMITWTPIHPFTYQSALTCTYQRLSFTGLISGTCSALQTRNVQKTMTTHSFLHIAVSDQLAPDCFPKYWLPKVTLSWNLLAALLVWALSYREGWYERSLSASVCGSWLSYNHHGSYHQSPKMRTPSLNYLQSKKPQGSPSATKRCLFLGTV